MKKATFKWTVFLLIMQLCALSPSYSAQNLPQLADINFVEIRSAELNPIVISEQDKLFRIVSFFNQFQDGWPVPLNNLPESTLVFTFHSQQGVIGEMSMNSDSVSRIYGEFWHQDVPKHIIKKFAGSVHPAIEEILFPIIPVDFDKKHFEFWQYKLANLPTGASHKQIKSFLDKNKIKISRVNNYKPEDGYWLKLKLSLINDGNFVDTILAAKLHLNKDHSLKQTQFLGFELSKKPNQRKILTTDISH